MFLDCEYPCVTGAEMMFLDCEYPCLTGDKLMFLDCEDPCLTGAHVLFSVCVLQKVPGECFQPATANIDCLNPEAYLYFFFFLRDAVYSVQCTPYWEKGRKGGNLSSNCTVCYESDNSKCFRKMFVVSFN
jgi:hypothetical protein